MSISPVSETGAPLHNPIGQARSLTAVWLAWFDQSGTILQMSLQSPENTQGIVSATGWGCVEVPYFDASPLNIVAVYQYQQEHWVDTQAFFPKVCEKTSCPVQLTGTVLSSLPSPCRIEISVPLYAPKTYEVSDASTLNLSFDHVGTYTIKVFSVRYSTGVFSITV